MVAVAELYEDTGRELPPELFVEVDDAGADVGRRGSS